MHLLNRLQYLSKTRPLPENTYSKSSIGYNRVKTNNAFPIEDQILKMWYFHRRNSVLIHNQWIQHVHHAWITMGFTLWLSRLLWEWRILSALRLLRFSPPPQKTWQSPWRGCTVTAKRSTAEGPHHRTQNSASWHRLGQWWGTRQALAVMCAAEGHAQDTVLGVTLGSMTRNELCATPLPCTCSCRRMDLLVETEYSRMKGTSTGFAQPRGCLFSIPEPREMN